MVPRLSLSVIWELELVFIFKLSFVNCSETVTSNEWKIIQNAVRTHYSAFQFLTSGG